MKSVRRRVSAHIRVTAAKTHAFLLFVAGQAPNSVQARDNLTRLCEEHLEGRYQIDIVDVLKHTARAIEYGVLVTPTLVMIKPRPHRRVLGNLSDTETVVAALRLNGPGR